MFNLKIGDIPEASAFKPKQNLATGTGFTLAAAAAHYSLLQGAGFGFSLVSAISTGAAFWLYNRHVTRDERDGYLLDKPYTSGDAMDLDGKINFQLTELVQGKGLDTIVTETRSHQYRILIIPNDSPKKVRELMPAISMKLGVDQQNLRFVQNYQVGKSAILSPLEKADWKAVDFDENQLTAGKLIGYVGQAINGDHVTYDREVEPHVLIAGGTNSGKTEATRADIKSMQLSGLNPKIHIIDPKEDMADVESDFYTCEVDEAVILLESLFKKAEMRKAKYSEAGCKNFFEYQRKVDPTERPWFVYIDEAADLLTKDLTEELEKGEHAMNKRAFTVLYQISRKSRAAGLFLTIIIQHPKAETLPTEIRNNLGARIVLSVVDAPASRVALDQNGAETLPKFGAFLFKTSLSNAPILGRGSYLQ